jgi:hypothetical protein
LVRAREDFPKYVDEQVFRYNNRKGLNDGGRLGVVVEQTFGKRLT